MWRGACAAMVVLLAACRAGGGEEQGPTASPPPREVPREEARPAPAAARVSASDQVRLERQRDLVREAARRRLGSVIRGGAADLPQLQQLLDSGAFPQNDSFALESLAVAFGDAIADDLGLRWVMVTNAYGSDPALRRPDGSDLDVLALVVGPLERGEAVDLLALRRQIVVAASR